MGHGHDGFLVPPVPDPAIARGEGAGGGADAGGEGGLDQGGPEPAVTVASPARAVLARALVVAGTEARPAGGVVLVASVDRTAYPGFARVVSARELAEAFTSTEDEIEWARPQPA